MIDSAPIVGGIVFFTLLWLWLGYNRLVRLRNLVSTSWSNVETELQRRYELIPNLVETVKGYADHEREVFDLVTRARSEAIATNGSPPDRQQPAEQELVKDLRLLFATAEAYPDLKASTNFLRLQHELSLTEDRIQLARRVYNANVMQLNTKVETVPSNLIARMFGFTQAAYFEIDPAASTAPDAEF